MHLEKKILGSIFQFESDPIKNSNSFPHSRSAWIFEISNITQKKNNTNHEHFVPIDNTNEQHL